MNITITQKDMENGVINSPTSDPIALAAQRAGFNNPRVGRHRMSFSQGKERVFIDLPEELKRFRSKLQYTDRHEMLTFKRKGLGGNHESATFTFKVPEVKPKPSPAAIVGLLLAAAA